RRERLPGGGAVDDEEVTVVEGGGGDLDEDLAGCGRGHGAVFELQGVDAVAAGDEGLHGWLRSGRARGGRMLVHHTNEERALGMTNATKRDSLASWPGCRVSNRSLVLLGSVDNRARANG